MDARASRSAAIVCFLALVACGPDEAGEDAKPRVSGAAAGEEKTPGNHTVRQRIHPSLPGFTFTLIGDKPDAANETIRLHRIEIRADNAGTLIQAIDGLDTRTPLSQGVPLFDVIDMNFDGYADFRLVESRGAGPNMPYLNWLYEPARRTFVPSPELNEIPSARFDPSGREIRSEWRDGPTRYGTDVYVYAEGKPILARKEERTYRAPGIYTLRKSMKVDGAWKTIEEREVRETQGR